MNTICPHCAVSCYCTMNEYVIGSFLQTGTKSTHFKLMYANCPSCSKLFIILQEYECDSNKPFAIDVLKSNRTIYPIGTRRAPLSPDVPEEFTRDYLEACLVFDDSPQASAALSRRCLQHLIREKAGITKKTLDQEIAALIAANSLPSYLSDDLDAVRNVGNMAAHPTKEEVTGQIIPVEPHEAEWLLNILENLFDFYFVQPAQAAKKRDALNAKLASAGKPPMRTPANSDNP